jgi:hypothetical protein
MGQQANRVKVGGGYRGDHTHRHPCAARPPMHVSAVGIKLGSV